MGDLSLDKLLLFVVIAFPGVVAIRVHALWYPTQPKDWKDSLVEAVTFSIINLLVWAVVFPSFVEKFATELATRTSEPEKAIPSTLGFVLNHGAFLAGYALVTPTLFVWLWYQVRRSSVLHRWIRVDHPVRTSWDWAFSRGEPFYVFVHLKAKDENGKQVIKAGYFGGSSYVSTYPQDPDLFIERLHSLKDDGTIGDPIPDSKGLFIRYSECERIEFLRDPGFAKPPSWWRWLRGVQQRRFGNLNLSVEGVWSWPKKLLQYRGSPRPKGRSTMGGKANQ
jgi:hypothetical protein